MKNAKLLQTIGYNIREARQKKNWTGEGLGASLGVTKACVSEWENGKIDLNISILNSIAIVLEIHICNLISSGSIT